MSTALDKVRADLKRAEKESHVYKIPALESAVRGLSDVVAMLEAHLEPEAAPSPAESDQVQPVSDGQDQ